MSIDTFIAPARLVDVSDRVHMSPNRITEDQVAELKRVYQVRAARIALMNAEIEPLADEMAALPNAAFAPWPQR